MPIKIDKKKDDLLAEYVGMLKDFYLKDHEKSPQEGYARAKSKAWSTYLGEHDAELAQRLYDYVSNKWFMYKLSCTI